MTTIAFIGAGNIGLPMLTRLVDAGHRVIAVDLKPERMDMARQAGAEATSDFGAAVSEADVVITMVLSGASVVQLYTQDGIIEKSKPDALLIDCSTIDIASSQAASRAAAAAGRAMIDSPISGGVARAAAGTLTAMVGGQVDHVERARPILSAMASTIHHMGDAGSGIATKLCNNLVTGISIVAVAEAFALGERLKLDPHKLYNVMTASSAKCWALDVMCPVPGPVPTSPANFGFKAGGAASLLVKDIGAAQQAGLQTSSPMPLGSAALSLYAMFCNAGLGDLDASAIIKLFNDEVGGLNGA